MNKLFLLLKTLFFLSISISIVAGQDICEALVANAFSQAHTNCAELGTNEICYGFTNVQAQFTEAASSGSEGTTNNLPGRRGNIDRNNDLLTSAGERLSVEELISVQTSALNATTGEWGIAVMNLQANVPSTLPDEHVSLILLGDVQIENVISSDEAYIPDEGVEIFVNYSGGGNVRSRPTSEGRLVGGAGYESTWLADAQSADGEWVRIAYNDRLAWLHGSVIADNPALAELPIAGEDLPPTYMQSFYLRTGTEASDCEDAPDNLLLIQSPENIETTVIVNGAEITLSSSGALRIVEIDGELFLEIIVFDGTFEVGGVNIGAGQHSLLCLGEESDMGLDGEANDRSVSCDPTTPSLITPSTTLCNLEGLPASLLNYAINVLCPGEGGGGGGGGTVTTGGDSEIEGVDCSSFAITTTQIVNGDFTLSWTAATGADSYQIAVYDNTNYNVSNFQSSSTSIFVNGGDSFPPSGYVDVRAFLGGAYACYTRLNYERLDTTANNPVGGDGSGQAGPPTVMYTIKITNYSTCTYTGNFGSHSVTLAPSGGSDTFQLPGGVYTYTLNGDDPSCIVYAGTWAVNGPEDLFIPA